MGLGVRVVEDITDTPAVLRAAAELIERNGLNKWDAWPGAGTGTPWEPGMPCCPLGAIVLVCGGNSAWQIKHNPAVSALVKHLSGNRNVCQDMVGGSYASRYYEVSLWSDHRLTTIEQVVATVRAAAEVEQASRDAASVDQVAGDAQKVAADDE